MGRRPAAPYHSNGTFPVAQYRTTPTLLDKVIECFIAGLCPYRVHSIPHGTEIWQNPQVILHTEGRILALCREAIAAKDESDVERIIVDLRAALAEHIQEAKAALEAQAAVIAAIGTPSETTTEER